MSAYEFDQAFQRKIAALVLRDTFFVTRTIGLIDPSYFELETDTAIVGVVLDYFERYKKAPERTIVPKVLKDAFAAKKIRGDMKDDIIARLRELWKTDVSDREYIIDEVASFAKHQAIEKAIVDSVHALEKRDYVKIEAMMKSAVMVGASDTSVDYDYFAEIDNRTEHRKALAAGLIKPDGISTGFAELDKYLYHSGWGRKELSVIMGAPKAGKSMSLGDFGKNASMLGYNVLYDSGEVSAAIIADRIDANLSDTAIRLLKDSPFDVQRKIKAAAAKAGTIRIREFPSGTQRPSQLRRMIQRYGDAGINFDLLIVDYADIMAPDRNSGDLREDLRQIFLELRAMAQEFNAAMLTATQTNREGAKAAVATMAHVAEDFNKVRTADLLISINALEEERASDEARLYIAASRNSEGDRVIRIKQDRAKMKFLTKVLGS